MPVDVIAAVLIQGAAWPFRRSVSACRMGLEGGCRSALIEFTRLARLRIGLR